MSNSVPAFTYVGSLPTLSDVFLASLEHVLRAGEANHGRDRPNTQVRMFSFVLTDPRARVIDVPARRTNLPFMMAEVLWQMSQRVDVAMLENYAPGIGQYSPNGVTFTGSAYGPRLFGPRAGRPSQWEAVLASLREDSESRRAVMTLLQEGEDRSVANRDMTCTLGLQLFVRNGRLDMVANMRSNDIMRGLASDVFFFTFLHEVAAAELNLPLGTYTHTANIGQVYNRDLDWARRCLQDSPRWRRAMEPIATENVWEDIRALARAEEELRVWGRTHVAPADVALAEWIPILEVFHAARTSAALADIDWPALYFGDAS